MQFVPFVGVLAALAGFLLSTRQFRFGVRLLIWILGASALCASVGFALQDPRGHSLVRTAFYYPDALLAAFDSNWQTIGVAFSPLIDLLCVASVILGLLCLIAFTPGDLMERIVRPVVIGLVGATLGATIALAIAGIGFGDAAKRKVYVGVITADDVHDGDTILMGDTALRIWGIDAPELNQPCAAPNTSTCGDLAKQRLSKLLTDELLVCEKQDGSKDTPRESFGRPLVKCIRQSDRLDVGREMVRVGCATVFRDKDKVKSDYLKEETAAATLADHARGCPSFDAPGIWRSQN